MRKALIALLVLAVLSFAGAIAFVYSGVIDVSATTKDPGFVRWVLMKTMRRSAAARAEGIAPPALDAPDRVKKGAVGYEAMCSPCHGAPGREGSEIGKGLNPPPPDLAHSAKELTAAQLFWLTKNGVRMTGMPAFGPTHDDEAIWDIIAFVQRLPVMGAEEYATLTATSAEHHHH
jgi:mono/diheme cytochrome c family protein